ncbi:MAG: hypothetical protein WBS24_03375 [Terriglobales bacterium]
MTQSMDTLLSARRAELANGAAPSTDVEVIPPADGQTGEILPAAGPPSVPAGSPVAPAPAELPTQFPVNPPKVLGGLPYAKNYMKLALTIHQTELVPKAFRDRPDAVMAAMMYGYELGLGPMQALNGLHVIDGKVGQDAELMRALITEAGHLFVVQSGTDEAGEAWATVYCRRSDWPEDIPTAEFTWTLQTGREAGLVEWYEKWTKTERGGNRKLTWNPYGGDERPAWVDGSGVELKRASSWGNYAEDMCIARATARAARANFADVLKGMSYTPEELAEFDGGNAGDAPQEASPSPAPQIADGPPAPPTSTAPAETAPEPAEPAKPAKKAAKAKKAAPIRTPAAKDLPVAVAESPSASTSPAPSTDPPVGTQQPDLEGNTPPPPPAPPELGDAGVVRELLSSLGVLLDAQPEANRRLLQAFLMQHFPGRRSTDLNADELSLAINIAGGWPESADRYPPPPPAGETVWEGFSAFVVRVGTEYEGRCQLCEWALPQASTSADLPDFRRLELMKQAATQHESGLYEDGTPFCPGRPSQPELG